jgi:hypothetical protein
MTDKIFAVRQILDKCYEYDMDIHIATYWAFLGNMIYAPYCISMVT